MNSIQYIEKLPQSIYNRTSNSNNYKLRIVLSDKDNELDLSIKQIRFIMLIDKMQGENLDQIGTLLKSFRNGKTDSIYKLFLKIAIIRLLSNGDIETINSVSVQILGADFVDIREVFPANYFLTAVNAAPIATLDEIKAIIKQISAAGVEINYFEVNTPAFTFADGEGEGFSDVSAPSSGGNFAGVWT